MNQEHASQTSESSIHRSPFALAGLNIGNTPLTILVVSSIVLIFILAATIQAQRFENRTLRSALESIRSDNANLANQLETLRKSLQGLPDTTPNIIEYTPRARYRVDATRAQWRFSGVTKGTDAEFLWEVDLLNRDDFNHSVTVNLEFLDSTGFSVAKASGTGTVFAKEAGETQRTSQVRGSALIPIRLAKSVTRVEVSWVTE